MLFVDDDVELALVLFEVVTLPLELENRLILGGYLWLRRSLAHEASGLERFVVVEACH